MDTRFVMYNLLKRPAFRLDSWYWFRKGECTGVSRPELKRQDRERVWHSPPMGYPIEAITTKLEMHAFPLEVRDYQMALSFELPSSRVELPKFDIVHQHAKALFHACLTLVKDGPISDREDTVLAA